MLCRRVRFACGSPMGSVPYGMVVRRGDRFGDCVAIFVEPHECVLAPSTLITFADRISVGVEEVGDYVVVTVDGAPYIYPRNLWDTIRYRYVEPLSKGEPPEEPGLFLHGAPGTGKTSMIEILAWMLGLHMVQIVPDEILHKYVGESEKRLKRKVLEAESAEPSILAMDDAEWITQSRQLSGIGADTTVGLTMLNIILRTLPKWRREGRRCLAVVATNLPPQRIDPALLRSGRLGKPVMVPLPDYGALRLLFERMGVPDAERHARRLANLGVNMADAVSYAREILKGREPKLEDVVGRGYVRPVTPLLEAGENVVSRLTALVPPWTMRSRTTRIAFDMPRSLGEPFAVWYSSILGVSSIVVSDLRYIDEAVAMAAQQRSVLVVPVEILDEAAARLLHATARSPVIYLGIPAGVPAKPVLSTSAAVSILGRRLLSRLVFEYYGIRYTDADLKHVEALSSSAFERMVSEAAYYAAGGDAAKLLRQYTSIGW